MKHFKTLEYEFHKSSCLGQNTGWHSSLSVNLDFRAGIPGELMFASAALASFHSLQPSGSQFHVRGESVTSGHTSLVLDIIMVKVAEDYPEAELVHSVGFLSIPFERPSRRFRRLFRSHGLWRKKLCLHI
jgi:hypothetical protein